MKYLKYILLSVTAISFANSVIATPTATRDGDATNIGKYRHLSQPYTRFTIKIENNKAKIQPKAGTGVAKAKIVYDKPNQ